MDDPILQMHRFYVGMNYEGELFGLKMSVKELKDGYNLLYSMEVHDIEIERIKKPSQSFNREGGWIGSKNIEPGSKNLKFKDFFEKFKPLNDLIGSRLCRQ